MHFIMYDHHSAFNLSDIHFNKSRLLPFSHQLEFTVLCNTDAWAINTTNGFHSFA